MRTLNCSACSPGRDSLYSLQADAVSLFDQISIQNLGLVLVLVHNIHLPNKDGGRRNHGDNDQRKVQFTELPWKNVDSLLLQYTPPE